LAAPAGNGRIADIVATLRFLYRTRLFFALVVRLDR
jgi:hypothetical protein